MLRRLAVFVFAAALQGQTIYHNPVIPGNNPDPSIIRVGSDYWATATTGDARPIFPLLHSRDLAQWDHISDVFKYPPSWAKDKFWAPEISEYNNSFYVYYSAECDVSNAACVADRGEGNPLCIGAAVASSPYGPYVDAGRPLVCQHCGSIDAMAFADGGKRYLIWKDDANNPACNSTTHIWAQELSPDGMSVEGQPTPLLQNDPTSWEHHVVEGPFLLKRNGYYYLFYSGAACCEDEQHPYTCDYRLGVARSRNLLGPYEKDPENPLLKDNAQWRCPGHGSIVSTPTGHTYLLHHAMASSATNGMRNAVLDEVTWNSDGWPSINHHDGVSSEGTVQ